MRTKIKGIITAAALLVLFIPIAVQADPYDDQIAALKAQISQNQDAANQKSAEADTLKNKLGEINAQISAARASLELTQTQIAQTQQQITETEAQLVRQKGLLKDNVRLAQQQADVSPLEVLASAESLSDLVNKQEFLKNIKNKIGDTLEKVGTLKVQLVDKNNQLAVARNQQQTQVDNIASQQSQQQQLLSQTQGEESSYQKIVSDNKNALNSVVAARAAAIHNGNIGITAAGCGGYPAYLCNADQDSINDPWGFPNRECTSYVAWKRNAIYTNRQHVSWGGDAGDWISHAGGGGPAPGVIIVWRRNAPYSGPFGHVAIVDSVNGNTVVYSQFNFNYGTGWGKYSQFTVSANDPILAGVGYIQ